MAEDNQVPKKVVENQDAPKVDWNAVDARQRALPRLSMPKGVFKFKSFEEADEWERKMRARPFPTACEDGQKSK
jgi:hypothetical protein